MSVVTHNKLTSEELFDKIMKMHAEGGVCTAEIMGRLDAFKAKVEEIERLKKEKNAVILAHTYVNPEILFGIADYIGDSYALSKDAMATQAKVIVFAAVRFMGQIAKILNPHKEVLIPATDDGCTLADAIDAAQVKKLRQQFPDYTFVCYVNTSAEVKAECDVCVTSSNVNKVVANIPNGKIYFLPDKMMGQNLITDMKKKGIQKDIKYFNGTCYVHEEYPLEKLLELKKQYPNAKVAAHPECRPEVCAQADFVGSTSQMYDYLKNTASKEFIMLTECGLSARLKMDFPDKKIRGSCTFCKYMKSNTFDEIIRVLKNPAPRDYVSVNEEVRRRALKTLEAMFRYTEG